MNITVITPSIPERHELLAECLESVRYQSKPPVAHLVGVDVARSGPGDVRNLLARAVRTEWLHFLDDDDLLDPNHLEVLTSRADPGADVIYTWGRLVGRNDGVHFQLPFNAAALRAGNFIPVTTAVRVETFLDAGGFRPGVAYEDWNLWLRLLDHGCRFQCIPEITWTYRWHGANRSYANDDAVGRGEIAGA
jgi:glycosyltransferase involved in cell wall biosynthesis